MERSGAACTSLHDESQMDSVILQGTAETPRFHFAWHSCAVSSYDHNKPWSCFALFRAHTMLLRTHLTDEEAESHGAISVLHRQPVH